MNHLGNANKMVRECVSNEQVTGEATPNEELRRQILSHVVPKNEREWWAARAIERLEFELNAANERIKRLEEAVDAYRKAYTPDGHVAPHDCFATGPKTGNLWQDYLTCPGCWAELKAKEAKP